jgi:hypothetical protein
VAGVHERNGDLLAPAAARLTARYGQLVGPDTVRLVLHETYEALLADATVTTYLPILAERSAATRLAHTPDRCATDVSVAASHPSRAALTEF